MNEEEYQDVGLSGADAPRPEPRPTFYTGTDGVERVYISVTGTILTRREAEAAFWFIVGSVVLMAWALSRR